MGDENKMSDDNCEAGTANVSSEAKMADNNHDAGLVNASFVVKMGDDNCESYTVETISEPLMIHASDHARVYELLDNIVMLNEIQRIRDLHTTPDCSAERLIRLIKAKEEKDYQMARLLRELVHLLMKPRLAGRNRLLNNRFVKDNAMNLNN